MSSLRKQKTVCFHFVLLFCCNFGLVHGLQQLSSRLVLKSKFLGDKPVFVAGGSSGTGLEIIKKLSLLGTPVKALVRRPESFQYLNTLPWVNAFLGDAMDSVAVQECMTDCVAAVTTLGGPLQDGQSERVDYIGNSNVVEQAGILGVEKIVLVTSVGCGKSAAALPIEIYNKLSGLASKSRAERDLMRYTNLDWTIIRPGRLTRGLSTGRGLLTENYMARGSIDRGDLADLVIRVLGAKDGHFTRKELTAIGADSGLNGAKYVPFVDDLI